MPHTVIPELLIHEPKVFGEIWCFFLIGFCRLLGKLARVVRGSDLEG